MPRDIRSFFGGVPAGSQSSNADTPKKKEEKVI